MSTTNRPDYAWLERLRETAIPGKTLQDLRLWAEVSKDEFPAILADVRRLEAELDEASELAAQWQAVAECRLQILNNVFTAKAKHEDLARAVHKSALELIAEPTLPADALAAHDRAVRAKVLREAAEAVINDPRRWPTVIANHIAHTLVSMADAAEKEAGNDGA